MELEALKSYLESKEIDFQLKVFGQKKIEFEAIRFDSRSDLKNSLFVCLQGENFDSHVLIEEILIKGTKIVFCLNSQQSRINNFLNYFQAEENNFALFFVEDTREILALVSSYFYQELLSKVKLIGITGTNGKTTVSYLSAQLLSKVLNKPVGLLGTTGFKVINSQQAELFLGEGAGRTTGEAPEILEKISQMHQEYSCEYLVMEVSSHALVQKRVKYLDFQVGAFLNLSQDHLDYHENMQAYLEAKLLLADLIQEKFVLNLDDSYAEDFLLRLEELELPILGFSCNPQKEFSGDLLLVEKIINTSDRIEALIKNSGNRLQSKNLQGKFNLYNLLAAISICQAFGLELEILIEAAKELKPAPGRFQMIEKAKFKTKIPQCIIDYAHTPDGLENVLKTASEITQKQQNSKLICVFGCGGDRDRTKRSLMGKIAQKYAQIMIVTSDNPRTEEPELIIQDIVKDLQITDQQNLETILDRAQAIRRAIELAKPEDLILIAGKGHENYQILKEKTIHFDDYQETIKALREVYSR